MSRTYTDIFFDLDRTLWDFERNSSETIEELFIDLKIQKNTGANFHEFFEEFKEANYRLWKDYRKNEISKDELRTRRFTETFFHFKSGDWKTAHKMSALYLNICPSKPHLIDGAITVLQYLSEHYNIHLITNGFAESQWIKIRSTGIDKYLTEIIISDETPYRKPMRAIFDYAMNKADCKPEKSIMIGDDLQKDVLGAKKALMDQIHFNTSEKMSVKPTPTFEVKKLKKLMDLL